MPRPVVFFKICDAACQDCGSARSGSTDLAVVSSDLSWGVLVAVEDAEALKTEGSPGLHVSGLAS